MSEQFSTNGERIAPALDLPLNLRVQATRVDYQPGGTTLWPHRHPSGAFVYIIEGSMRMGLEDEDAQVLNAGDSYYEPPGTLHALSENASDTEPASLLAVYVVPEGQPSAVAA